MTGIKERVKQTIVRALDLELSPADLADDEVLFGRGLGADSVTTLEIVFALEEEFAIEVEDEDLRAELFDSVQTLVDYIKQKLGTPA